MRKTLCAFLATLMLLGCTAFAAESETPGEVKPAAPEVSITLTQFDLKENKANNETMCIMGSKKVLWAIEIENKSDIALENYELMLPAIGALTLHTIDPFETTDSGKTMAIDVLAPGQKMLVPVILTAPCIKGLIYKNTNGRPEVNKVMYEATAILKPTDTESGEPAYISNSVNLTYTALKTSPMR